MGTGLAVACLWTALPGFAQQAAATDAALNVPVPPAVIVRDGDGRSRYERRGWAARSPSTARSTRRLHHGPPFGEFVQQEPYEGQPATEKTEVWVFFDDKNVYVVGAALGDRAGAPRHERHAA